VAVSEIPEKLFYKIGEVCQYTDTQPYVLRFWESEFPLLAPQKNRSGQRVYSREDIDLVFKIKELLYDQEYTIAGARKQLEHDLESAAAPSSRKTSRAENKSKSRSNTSAAARLRSGKLPADGLDGPKSVSPAILGSGSTHELARLERRLADMEDRWRRAEKALEETDQAKAELEARCLSVAAKLENAAQIIAFMRRSARDIDREI
jgi:DNA-binding transcriptional MerR regulator